MRIRKKTKKSGKPFCQRKCLPKNLSTYKYCYEFLVIAWPGHCKYENSKSVSQAFLSFLKKMVSVKLQVK